MKCSVKNRLQGQMQRRSTGFCMTSHKLMTEVEILKGYGAAHRITGRDGEPG